MVRIEVQKRNFLPDWAGEFMLQLLVSFDLKIKNLKNVEFKSKEERVLYFCTDSTYQDIYFLYFIDYIEKIVSAHRSNKMPTKIMDYPLYIDYAIKNSLSRILQHQAYSQIETICQWIKKIMEANAKFLKNTQSSEMIIRKYSEALSSYLSNQLNKKQIDLFLSEFSTSNQLALQALNGINGIDGAISLSKSSDILLMFTSEKNIFVDVHSRLMFPLMVCNSSKISNITPSRIGAVISYAKNMMAAGKLESIELNNAQVIASLFQEDKKSSEKDAIKKIFFEEMGILSSSQIAELHNSKDVEFKINRLSVALLLNEYEKHFEEIKPIIAESIKICIVQHLETNREIDAELLYDIGNIIKAELKETFIYKNLKGYKEEINNYLRKEISNIILNELAGAKS